MNKEAETISEVEVSIPFEAKVWMKLSGLDISDLVEKRGNFDYLPWAAAWSLLMSAYPESCFKFLGTTRPVEQGALTTPYMQLQDGSVEVSCEVTIRENELRMIRQMWLPVMAYDNKAIEYPNTREISDAKMRCLVKTLALCGLGITLYKGDGLPYIVNDPMLEETANAILKHLEFEEVHGVVEVWNECSDEQKTGLWKAITKGGWFTQAEKTTIREYIGQVRDEEHPEMKFKEGE